MSCRIPLLLLLLAAASVTDAREPSPISWAKPGVSFDQYRSDAIECAKLGYFRDISNDEPAKRFVRGFRSAHDDINKADIGGVDVDAWRDSILRTQPDRQKEDIHALQVKDVEECLSSKGYVKFHLSRSENKQLARYPLGSAARHTYLHRLASRN